MIMFTVTAFAAVVCLLPLITALPAAPRIPAASPNTPSHRGLLRGRTYLLQSERGDHIGLSREEGQGRLQDQGLTSPPCRRAVMEANRENLLSNQVPVPVAPSQPSIPTPAVVAPSTYTPNTSITVHPRPTDAKTHGKHSKKPSRKGKGTQRKSKGKGSRTKPKFM